MRKLYTNLLFTLLGILALPQLARSQDCSTLTAVFTTYESRCAATGSIKILATGGSGDYKYKVTGPTNTNYTTTDSITGLSAGIYTITINDITNNCTISITNAEVLGTYQDPRFTLNKQDVTCDNGNNGSITVNGLQYGLAPFTYSIVAPSPMGIGTSNSTGVFSDLIAGDYSIRLTDSCGGIQTRQITVGNYSWWIDSYSFTKTACDEATGFIKVVDSRGNISTVSGIPGFTYGIVRSPGDTIWSADATFAFSLAGQNTFEVIVKDNCGLIKKATVTLVLTPSTAGTATMYDYLCNSFSASLSVTNFFTPDFCLYDSADVLISCNSTGIFTGIPYGNYCIRAHDACTDTTISRCFTAIPPPISVNNTVAITNKTCTTFTATITGQTGLTNPDYCIYNAADSLLSCNTTGIFTDLPYGPYCIKTKDNCRDTTITRCFEPLPPIPVVPDVIIPAYVTCTVFGITVNGDSMTLPQYCLLDTTGAVIICNNTGVFDSIPLGNYCVSIHDDCTDTTITRCFSVTMPTISNDMVTAITNRTCSTFTVSARSNNFIRPNYCLYDSNDILISCDSSGIFSGLPYGNYCIKATLLCPDTTLTSCFSASPPLPAINASINTHHPKCSTFSATVTGLTNFTDPEFCLYDNNNVLISCNLTGSFDSIPYGNYCVKVKDGCYDTTVTKCFSKAPVVISLTGSGGRSCSFGYAKFTLNMGGGALPVNIRIIKPNGTLLSDTSYNTNNVTIDSIPGIPTGNFYTIIATDNCGNKDTLMLGAPASYFTHVPTVLPKCPGASWANGSGDIQIAVSTNLGALTVRIIKKDGVTYSPSLVPNSVVAGVFTFTDLGPGTYILTSSENSCNKKFSDTITIQPYQFPNLSRSSAYQCDVNGFSVSAIASGGVPPFTYEIIGSIPAFPSIISAPQTSPVFNINNGTTYSLIRLRALDACGNATLGDASILPLAMTGIEATANCFTQPTTLSIDPILNATYSWYKKTTVNSADSTYIGSATSYYIPEVTLFETGWYVCYVSVNSGCINRVYWFHLDGLCYIVLPVKLQDFKGQVTATGNTLTWNAADESSLSHYTIERKNGNGSFTAIGRKDISLSGGNEHSYLFDDNNPSKGVNQYRLRLVNKNGTVTYSNVVALQNDKAEKWYSIYPNPVRDMLTIDFKVTKKHSYRISLINAIGQVIGNRSFTADGNSKLQLPRTPAMIKGMYIIRIEDVETAEVVKEKVVYL